MDSRRIALSLGMFGSGVAAAAFLYPASAVADSYTITPDPTGSEIYTSLAGQPPHSQAVDGLQLYDYQDVTTGDTGSFQGLSLNAIDPLGVTNQEIVDYSSNGSLAPRALVVDGDNSLAQGSVFDTVNYGHGFENVYTDLAGTGSGSSNTITDTVVTPFGNMAVPTTFDAIAAQQAADFTYLPSSAILPGYSFVPDPDDQLEIRSVSGTLPMDQSTSGLQYYDVDDPTGANVDGFNGVSYYDINASGQTNQEILVAPYGFVRAALASDRGFGGGGGFHGGGFGGSDPLVPPAGSLFDTTDYGHGFENVYSDVPATGFTPQTITDTFVTPFGNINVPTTFDADAALPAAEFSFPAGSTTSADYSYVPDSDYQEFVTSISGRAMVDQVVTGRQLFDVDDPTGNQVGSFYGLSTHQVDAMGFSNQEILVGNQPVAVAQADLAVVSTDAPAPGSFFDTFSWFGFENIYSDVVGTDGANTVTDTLITPFGDFAVPTSFEATAVLNAAEFFFPTT